MHPMKSLRGSSAPSVVASAALLLGMALAGCGGEGEGPTNVPDDVKQQQVRELQEQRASEWGGAKKK